MPSRTLLLQHLNDSEFVTGTVLGRRLGISRAAVHKHISNLKTSGLPIDCVRGRGYRLARGIVPLNAAGITDLLSKDTLAEMGDLHIVQSVGSTNDFLRRNCDGNRLHGAICLAEAQSAGRGRCGNDWIASPYRNLIMSLGWVYTSWPQGAAGLSVAVSMELIDALAKIGVRGLGIKWPNDIVHNGRKLGGILIDAYGESVGHCALIIGVGMNVELTESDGALIDQPWTDLTSVADRRIDRNNLAASCITGLYTLLRRYDEVGFAPFRDRWRKMDVLGGHTVTVTFRDGGEQLTGRALGVDDAGGLIVCQQGGGKTVCYHGNVRVKAR